jgi:hypothetical protein
MISRRAYAPLLENAAAPPSLTADFANGMRRRRFTRANTRCREALGVATGSFSGPIPGALPRSGTANGDRESDRDFYLMPVDICCRISVR